MAQVKAIVDKLLTNVSNGYFPEGYISESALPELAVKQRTGKIGKYGKSHLRVVDTKMAGRGKAPRFEPIIRDSDLYSVEKHGLEGMVTEDDYDNVELPFDAEKDETNGLTSSIWLGKELALNTVMTNASIITQTSTPANKYDDYTNSTPLVDFRVAQNTILDGCGLMPNRAVTSQKVINVLKYHPGILSTLGFADNRAGTLTLAEIAHAMGVESLHVGKVSYNNAHLGQTDALNQLWGDTITFYYAPATAQKYQQSFGYYMKMSGRGPRQVYKFAIDNPPNAKGIIVQDDYSFVVTDAKCAYLLTDVLS